MNQNILHLTFEEEFFYHLKENYNVFHIQTDKDLKSKEVKEADMIILIDEPRDKHITREKLAFSLGMERCYIAEFDWTIYDLIDIKPYPVKGIFTIEDCLEDLKNAQKGKIKEAYSTGWY